MIFGSIFNYFTQNNWYKQLENLVLYLFIIFERFLIVRFLLNSWKWWNFVCFWTAEILFTSKLGRIWRGIEWNTLLWPMDEILSQGPRFFGILTWFWNFMLCPMSTCWPNVHWTVQIHANSYCYARTTARNWCLSQSQFWFQSSQTDRNLLLTNKRINLSLERGCPR